MKAVYSGGYNLTLSNWIKKYLGFDIKTKLVGRVIPQIKWKYGDDALVNISLSLVEDIPQVQFSERNASSN
jgi:predicted subunit of tRNA(5-methylaminomethyl-2-thiouridylate) methyltransferase